MQKDTLVSQLHTVIHIVSLSKLRRLIYNPFRYAVAIFSRYIYYPVTKRGIPIKANTFFGEAMQVLLPAGTDIYLTSGKAHDSEIRLSYYIINTLKDKGTFVDVGAHFGFFSLLASTIVGRSGKVIAFEGGKDNFQILHNNVNQILNIYPFNKVVSNTNGQLKFYQFPSAYSEYNSLDIDQYKDLDWIANNPPEVTTVPSIRLNDFLEHEVVDMIKIDVEGGELGVLTGLEEYLTNHSPIIIMEYLSSDRNNTSHVQAVQYLLDYGYHSNIINPKGRIQPQGNLSKYMRENILESENIVFIKQK